MARRMIAQPAAVLVTIVLGLMVTTAPTQAAPPQAPAPALSSDYDGDGVPDLAIGEPARTVNGLDAAGVVRIVSALDSSVPATGSLLIAQNTAGVPGVVSDGARFGRAVASGNFDGDTYADLAIGTSWRDEVVVLYGSPSGLHGTLAAHAKAELLTPANFMPEPALSQSFGHAVATADFNVDGYADLAIGAPTGPGGGGVAVVYGGPGGLVPSSNPTWIDQDTNGVPGIAESGDTFGYELAAGDFNGDGHADLGVTAPFKTVSGVEGGGEITVLFANAYGTIEGTGALSFNQDSPGMPDTVEFHDHFGLSIAAGDLTGDGFAELIASGPESIGTTANSGLVIVLKGSSGGTTTTGAQSFAGKGDLMGSSLAVVNTDGDSFAELAIGIPHRAGGDLANVGVVWILPGTADGPTTVNSVTWTQDSPGVLDQGDAGDRFGSSLLSMDGWSGNYGVLVVGIREETALGCTRCGAVGVYHGSSAGLTGSGDLFISGGSLAGGGFTDGYFADDLG